jgi:ATP-dependent Clp protease ATP-binding subunit ClpC
VFERFTDRARKVLTLAQDEARQLEHPFIGTEHILLGVLREGNGMGAEALRSLGITFAVVRARVVDTVGRAGAGGGGSPPFTPRAKKVLELALREALQRDHSYIGTEHILLGLVREGEGVAAKVLEDCGASPARVRRTIDELIAGGVVSGGVDVTHDDPGEAEDEIVELANPPHEPVCPGCRALLRGAACLRSIRVPHDDPSIEPRVFTVAYCTHCGTTLQMFEQDATG